MMNNAFEVRYPRGGSAIGSLICLFGLSVCIDYRFLHYLDYTIRAQHRGGIGFWVAVACVLGCLAITLKTSLFPSLIFAADAVGIEIGSGVFRNRVMHIPWSMVRDIGEGVIAAPVSNLPGRTLPALCIRVDPVIRLSASGFDLAHMTGDCTWAVSSTLFQLPLADAVRMLQTMQRATSATGRST